MRKVAVIGVGETPFTGPQEKTSLELLAEAGIEAIESSAIKPRDVQALFIGNALGDFSEGQGMIQSYASDYLGCRNVPANRYEGACASASMAVRDAFIWMASGMYDIVLAGGVSANSFLRKRFETICENNHWTLYMPELQYCGDHGAMVAAQGYYEFIAGRRAGLDLNAKATMAIDAEF